MELSCLNNPSVTLIFPAYMEGTRRTNPKDGNVGDGSNFAATLDKHHTALDRLYPNDYALVVVDDGSTDNTSEIALASGAHVLRYEQNAGRGRALKLGFTAVTDQLSNLQDTAIGYTDADGAYSADHMLALFDAILEDKNDLAVSYRLDGFGGIMRRIGHTTLYTICERFAPTGIKDPQAGAKVLSGQASANLWPQVTVDGWSADKQLACLTKAKGLSITEIGAHVDNSGDSRVKFLRDSIQMVRDSRDIGKALQTLNLVQPVAAGRRRSAA